MLTPFLAEEEEMETTPEVLISRKVIRRGNIPMTGPVMRLGPLIPEGFQEINNQIVQATTRVFEALGPGFHEGVYKVCMAQDLSQRGLTVRRAVAFPLEYEGLLLDTAFRLDMLV